MSLEKQHTCPSLEEIIAAAKPEASAEIRTAIKTRLKFCMDSDEVLAGAIKFLEDHNYDFDALHQFLEMPVTFFDNKKKSPGIIIIKRFSVAAAIFIILGGVGWFYFFRQTPAKIVSNSVIYEPGLPVFASIQGNREFHELMSAFRMKDAITGLGYYHSLIRKELLNDTLFYFGGWLYFLNEQEDSAALNFKKVTEIQSGIFQNKAEYMQAICLYLSNKKDESKQIFENIKRDKTNPYREKAISLLLNKKLW